MAKKVHLTFNSGVKLEYDFVKDVIESVVSDWKKLKLLSTKYVNTNSKLAISDECGYKYSIAYSNIVQNYQRNQEFNKFHSRNIFTIDNIENWLLQNDINYELQSTQYKNAKSKLLWLCPDGHSFSMNWNNFQSGKRCPNCKSSKGENKVAAFLDDNEIKYKREYTFDDCRNIRVLPFDFAIFNRNQLYCLLEYDGEQHFNRTGWENASDNKLEGTILTDSIKNDYCESNDIKLIRIPYWDFSNLDKILKQELVEVINIEK